MKILEMIKRGDVTLKWDEWVFGGGRDWGDWQSFKLYENGIDIGYLQFSVDSCRVMKFEDGFIAETEVLEYEEDMTKFFEIYNILIDAIKRDDKEVAEKLVDNQFPHGYDDISREELLRG